MMNLIKALAERNLLYQTTNENPETITGIYVGIDATAPSLQVGNLNALAALRVASLYNIPTIALIGGATTQVGDPSGKSESRKKLENTTIESNIKKITAQIKKLVPDAKIVNNIDWIKELDFMSFIQKVARYTSVASLIKLETFAKRLECNAPLNTEELLYPLMQAYDFLWLYENENCNAQCGGSDQWCNILPGIELIKKSHNSSKNQPIGITFPLLTNAEGKKLGKSLTGAIYCDSSLCCIYDFWQFWRNIDDSKVHECLKKLTTLSINEIKGINDINQAKITLANEITEWVHGKEEAQKAYKQAQAIFKENNLDNLNTLKVYSNKLVEVLVELEVAISNSAAKKLIEQSAIKVNQETIKEKTYQFNKGQYIISAGKKKFYKIEVA